MLRALLWPDPDIATTEFIALSQQTEQLDRAHSRIAQFHFIGFMEQADFDTQLSAAIDRLFRRPRRNETIGIPPALIPNLKLEFTAETYQILLEQTQLDSILWAEILRGGDQNSDPSLIGETTFLRSLLKYVGSGVSVFQ